MADYEVKRHDDDVVTLALVGTLSGERQVQELHDALKEHYVDDGVRRIRADVGRLEGISMEGVAILILLLKESARRGKRFEVVNAKGAVRDKLAQTGVLSFLEAGG